MVTIVTSVIILASVLLVFVVYVQNPKGGGLSTDFGAAQQIGGVQKTNDFIDKATWGLAILVGGLSIILTIWLKSPETVVRAPEQTEQQQQQQQPQQPQQQQPTGN